MKIKHVFAVVAAAVVWCSSAMAQQLILTEDLPAEFQDISGTGIPLNPTDDGHVDMVTTISNALFPAGTWRVGNNGGMGMMAPATAGLPPGPGFPVPLPNPLVFGGVAQALLPGWDDPGDAVGNVYWQEFPGVKLIVQWDRNLNPGTDNTTSFQVVIPHGTTLDCGIYAQFIYRDVQQTPRPNGGQIYTIGYQDGEAGTHNSVVWPFRPIVNHQVLTLTCIRDVPLLSNYGTFAIIITILAAGVIVLRIRR